ncbi:Hypothetical predicted protein, partial [Paramuricea clavata]
SLAIVWFAKVMCELEYVEPEFRQKVAKEEGISSLIIIAIKHYASQLPIKEVKNNNAWAKPLFSDGNTTYDGAALPGAVPTPTSSFGLEFEGNNPGQT